MSDLAGVQRAERAHMLPYLYHRLSTVYGAPYGEQ